MKGKIYLIQKDDELVEMEEKSMKMKIYFKNF